MTHQFEFRHRNDDEFEICLNGDSLMRANYDDHGSTGMADLRKLTERIAKAIGAEVTDIEGSDDED